MCAPADALARARRTHTTWTPSSTNSPPQGRVSNPPWGTATTLNTPNPPTPTVTPPSVFPAQAGIHLPLPSFPPPSRNPAPHVILSVVEEPTPSTPVFPHTPPPSHPQSPSPISPQNTSPKTPSHRRETTPHPRARKPATAPETPYPDLRATLTTARNPPQTAFPTPPSFP